MRHRRGFAALLGAIAATMMLALVAAPALAKATYQLKVNVPRHPKSGGTYTATGSLYLNRDVDFVAVIYDKDKCSNSYATESHRATDAGLYNAGAVLPAVEAQGQFNQPFQMSKYAKKAHNLCGYLFHDAGSYKYHTDRVVKLRYSLR
jgi:hypothetical protein